MNRITLRSSTPILSNFRDNVNPAQNLPCERAYYASQTYKCLMLQSSITLMDFPLHEFFICHQYEIFQWEHSRVSHFREMNNNHVKTVI